MNNNNFFGGEQSDVKQAVYFLEDGEQYQVNPIYNLDETSNTPDRFVILKTTQNGRFLIGDMIHYNVNGLDIITDSDNAIFVDKINNTIFVREYGKALREISPEDPEKRQYVILIVDGSDDDIFEWVALEGRINAYEYIKSHIYTINAKESIILTENVTLKDSLTVYQFVKFLKNGDIVNDDFDIDEFESEEY